MGKFLEKYKVWMPWSWVSVGLFLAAMYFAKAVYYTYDAAAESFRPAHRRRAVVGLGASGTRASSIPFGSSGPVEVQVFGRQPAADKTRVDEIETK